MLESTPGTPGALLGHWSDGRPFYLIAGGSGQPAAQDGGQSRQAPGQTTGQGGGQSGGQPRSSLGQALGQSGEQAPGQQGGQGGQAPAQPPGQQSGQAQGQQGGQGPDGEGDISTLPEWAQREIRSARAEAAKNRVNAKQAAVAEFKTDLARALGITPAAGNGDGSNGGDGGNGNGGQSGQPGQQLSSEQHDNLVLRIDNIVLRTASRHDADPNRLLDSRQFENILAEHVTVDPSDPQFPSQVETAIKTAVDTHPEYKTTGQAPARSGTPMPGSPGGTPARPTSLSDAVSKALRGT